MMGRRNPEGIVGTSARAPDDDGEREMRTLKFEGNGRRRFCGCIWTVEGYKCWTIGDFSGSDIWRQM
jgi:hypothetical protein